MTRFLVTGSIAGPIECRSGSCGKPLALEFTRTHLADAFDEVRAIFSRRGAYGRFKDLLERRDSLQAWYDWEHEQTLQALRDWCADNDLAVRDEKGPPAEP